MLRGRRVVPRSRLEAAAQRGVGLAYACFWLPAWGDCCLEDPACSPVGQMRLVPDITGGWAGGGGRGWWLVWLHLQPLPPLVAGLAAGGGLPMQVNACTAPPGWLPAPGRACRPPPAARPRRARAQPPTRCPGCPATPPPWSPCAASRRTRPGSAAPAAVGRAEGLGAGRQCAADPSSRQVPARLPTHPGLPCSLPRPAWFAPRLPPHPPPPQRCAACWRRRTPTTG